MVDSRAMAELTTYRWDDMPRESLKEGLGRRLISGDRVEVVDSGGCVASNRPAQPLPGRPAAHVLVRVRVPDPAAIDRPSLTAAVEEIVPAHVAVTVEVRALQEAGS